jgi:psp operon transcriptional activator
VQVYARAALGAGHRGRLPDGGTLFLDELGLMPLAVQEKLLRTIEYGTFERVGASESIQVDVRLVAATNLDLEALVAAGRFKADLLDRLSFQVLYLPPLRLRQDDMELLANHFANRFAVELGLECTPRFTATALAALRRYHWPGNIRELKNVVERAVYLSESADICEVILNPFTPPFEIRLENGVTAAPVATGQTSGAVTPGCVDGKRTFPVDFGSVIADREVELLRSALEAARYQQRQAATLLSLTYDKFRGLYRKHRHRLDAEPVTAESSRV